jgi:hypothetical protein
MKGDKINKILDLISSQSLIMVDLLEALIRSGYGAPMSKLDREYNKLKRGRENLQFEKLKRRQLENYIYKLRSEGLVTESSDKKIILSQKGKDKSNKLKKNEFLDKKNFTKKKSDRVIIVSYDLPIKFNRERDRLREILKVLGFKMIHKSVWVGKVRLPENLIRGLDKMHLLAYIEILEITKHGSLKPL